MPNSRYHCDTCEFGEVSPTSDPLTANQEHSLAAETYFASGGLTGERNASRIGAVKSLAEQCILGGLARERVVAAQACAAAMIEGACKGNDLIEPPNEREDPKEG